MWDVSEKAASREVTPTLDVFADEIAVFSKYRLAKAFLRWTRDHAASDLSSSETAQWKSLIAKINKALK